LKFPRWSAGRRSASSSLLGLAVLLASVSLVPVSAGAAAADKVDGTLRHLAAQTTETRLPILITRRTTSGVLDTLKAHGANVRHQLTLGNLVAADVAPSELSAIAADPDVLRVAYDAPMQTQSTAPDPLTLTNNLRSVYPIAVQASQAWTASTPLVGTGVGIAVIDSGIDAGNKDFEGATYNNPFTRVISLQAMITGSSSTTDGYGHGTWVSGIAAGRGWGYAPGLTGSTEGHYIGIAPDATLIELKANDSTGVAHESDVINALQWVTATQALFNIRVVNLSLVSSVAESYRTSALDAAVEMAWLHGIVVVVSAGNGGPNTSLYAPANDPYVITVGATDDKGTASTTDDQLAFFSSYGTTQDGFAKPELVAPGRHIVGPLASGGAAFSTLFPNNILAGEHNLYIQLSGTSASAPIVTGVIADVLQRRPTLTPDYLKGLLMQTALPVAGTGTGVGYPQTVRAAYYDEDIHRANVGLVPNNYVAAAGCQSLPSGTNCTQANWSSVSWNSVSWNSVSWNSVSWNSVSWNSVSWNSVSWNNVLGS